jgi:hypothetical protein
MTDENMALLALIQKSDDGDFLKTVAEAALQRIMDYDVENLIGAAPHERNPDRQTYRNGYRERTLETRLGSLELKVPKLRTGTSYFPAFLEPRRTIEKALTAVIIRGRRRAVLHIPHCARQAERDRSVAKQPLAVVGHKMRPSLQFAKPARGLAAAVEMDLSRLVGEVVGKALQFERCATADDERHAEDVLQG